MSSPSSVDLRQRVVSAVSEGASCHQAAARFGVSVSSASRWSEQFRQERQLAPKPLGGDQASHRIEAQADQILMTYEARPAIFLHELCDALSERCGQTSMSSLSPLFARHAITRKKWAIHAAERAREDVGAAREAWFESQDALDPDRLVFRDKTAAATNMARRYGRAPRARAAGLQSRTGTTKPPRSLPACAAKACAPLPCSTAPPTAHVSKPTSLTRSCPC